MWLLLMVCTVFLVVKTCSSFRNAKRYPPGPRGLPILGNLLYIRRLVQETGFDWGAWKRLAEIYGPIVRIQLPMEPPIVIITGVIGVRELVNRREFDGRPNTIGIRMLGFDEKRRGIAFNDGSEWVEQKRFVLKALKDFGFGKRSMEGLISEDTKMLCDEINEKLLNNEICITNLVEMTAIAVVNSLWNLISGKKFDLNDEDSEVLALLKKMNQNFRNGTVIKFSQNFQKLLLYFNYIIKNTLGFKNQIKVPNDIKYFFLEEVSIHKKTRTQGQPRDLIDVYLDKLESTKKDNTSTFDDLQLVTLIRDIFAAGIETTSNVIGFAVAYLAKYPNVQMKVHNELDQIVGKNGVVKLEYKNSLPYLNATIAEVSRLANVAPTTIGHRVTTDCSILGYDVKKNWTIIGSLQSVHMDPAYWTDAKSFRPERFIDQNGKLLEDQQGFMPFGMGRRKCPGENLAKMSLFLFMGNLLQKFQFRLAPKETAPSLLGINGFTLAVTPIKIVIESRCD